MQFRALSYCWIFFFLFINI